MFEDLDFYFAMQKEKIKVKIGGGRTIVYLEPSRNMTDELIWKIPEGISDLSVPYLFMELTESGGKTNKYSYSHIVCSVHGEKLLPYHIPTIKKPLGNHAYFAVRHKVCTVECFDYKYLKITEVTANMLTIKRICYLSENVIFEGTQKNLPSKLDKFSQAIFHAVIKANCLECQYAHYVLDQGLL